MSQSRIGAMALACAAVDDVTAWCLLAFVVGIAQSNPSGAALTVILTIGYLAFMLLVVRPGGVWLARHFEQPARRGHHGLALLCVALLLSALATEAIGIHALFGAFLLGAVIPHDSAMARAALEKLDDVVVVLFLPAFFALTGMRTQIGLVSGIAQWLTCALIIVVASAGKFGGTLFAARATGLGWRDAASLGVLMNTRGLMELIVLHVGLDLGVVSPTLFAMMVLMALVTTLTTTPLLHALAFRPNGLANGMLQNA
jgi:Kef-type K+ transport system membrane component KefB